MSPQVDKETFRQALTELGHNPDHYAGKRISLSGMSELYEIDQDLILEAIDGKKIAAHYDYQNDTIWVDALDAAHFYYCIRNYPRLGRTP
ncbi:MAG: hypothetical protein ACOH5I_01275 [Oligoflexus sp.]